MYTNWEHLTTINYLIINENMIDMFMCKYGKIKEILKFAHQRKQMALDYLSLSIVHQKGKSITRSITQIPYC